MLQIPLSETRVDHDLSDLWWDLKINTNNHMRLQLVLKPVTLKDDFVLYFVYIWIILFKFYSAC